MIFVLKVANTSLPSRIGRYTDTTASNTSGVFGTTTAFIANLTQLKNDFTPTYEVLNTNYMVWYDYAVIKLATVVESLTAIGLTRKADIFLRLYINAGTLNASISSPNSTAPGYSLTVANNGFNATRPFTINYLTEASAGGGIPATVANIIAGLYLPKVSVMLIHLRLIFCLVVIFTILKSQFNLLLPKNIYSITVLKNAFTELFVLINIIILVLVVISINSSHLV